jgi:DNA topoisomerase-2
MSIKSDPVINDIKNKGGDFTCVTFKPDLRKFNMENLDDGII